ncbi:diguanylate cyclase [Dechloromonas sp. ZY10]|uniref:GGDEF domain-containing response regulator n=1 Tax=Dechloromonas aquae TaxID=2664436 RepID=UPI003528224D
MKILLVEDMRAVAALMTARLIAFGYEVCHAENGQLAVEAFRREAPDLVLMDLEMPVMNGIEATSRIRALEAGQVWTPIIFLTASDTPDNLVMAIDAGADDFLSKTVPENVLQAKMRALNRIAALRRELAEANLRLQAMAHRDGLTGLANRRRMDSLTDAAWAQANQQQAPFGLLMLDVDNFKRYNDHYGHQAGDDCLRAVAAALEAGTRNENPARIVARYGGEEFAIVLPGYTADDCQRVAGQVLATLRARRLPHEKNGDWGIVTASLGGAWLAQASGRIADLFRTADANLYRAKENGRNRCEMG